MSVASGSPPIELNGDQAPRSSLPTGPPVDCTTGMAGALPPVLTAVASLAAGRVLPLAPALPVPAPADLALAGPAPGPFGLPAVWRLLAVAGRAVGEPGRTGPCFVPPERRPAGFWPATRAIPPRPWRPRSCRPRYPRYW